MLKSPVDSFCWTVAGSWPVEVGKDALSVFFQRFPQAFHLDERFGQVAGWRKNPLKQAGVFESRGACGALGDKGADDGHMSRFVVLPDLLKRQLQAYKAHCSAITAQLEHHLPQLPAPTNGFFLQLADGAYLSYEEIRPIHIKAVMRQIEGFTPHPVNGFRKLLRTELAERGCPPETLSAFMGHWLSGEEPQDIYSSFCPRTYVQGLHTYLLPLMRELGWTVRNSHLVVEADA